jgi:1,4-alpha-glucan branching enzyme
MAGTGHSDTIEHPKATLADLDLRQVDGGPEPLYASMGAHVRQQDGVTGTRFAVWAPGARTVSVVGDFNCWDGRLQRMREVGSSGMWELFVPGVEGGARYQYEIVTDREEPVLKSDPYAQQVEPPPDNTSVVCEPRHVWSVADLEWLRTRRGRNQLDGPMSIYEVHLGSWRRNPREDDRPLTYLELADELSAYVQDMGFTHVELLPVMAHPFSGSWGYQVSSYFAPSPRHGTPDGLRQLVDRLHQAGIGVILDWVPAHFSRDQFALPRFDGTPLYEHHDATRSAHPDWGTVMFNYARPEVRSFLIASALFWLRGYHADGIRVDAVASMLYLDFREDKWLPNELGGREDPDAVAFLGELNDVISERQPGVVSIAEETSARPAVSRSTSAGGLGFGLKWNTGWIYDTLYYLRSGAEQRPHLHHRLNFGLMYAFSENFVLPLSHDEVVPGKGSLLAKMAGDRRQKLANLRALYAYTWAHPGKKLLFMGSEFAQEAQWSDWTSLDWHLLAQPEHASIQALVRDLNRIYRDEPALWELDFDPAGFRWLEADDAASNVIAFVRASLDHRRLLVFAANFSFRAHSSYRLGLPRSCRWREALNTDAIDYGGRGATTSCVLEPEPVPWQGQPVSAEVMLPPLSAMWLVPERD